MSKKSFKSQASSSRVVPAGFNASTALGSAGFGSGFGSGFGTAPASKLSYVYEPPDLSLISDSSVQKAFKTLQKKDSTTKTKALEDLQLHLAHLQKQGETVEDAILEAWVLLYPRTSIDNSRRVRQLAHAFQGQIAAYCGKRIVKHMPSVVGAWLCGLQDNDRTVARGVQESFDKVFTSPEKQQGVWQKFQSFILDYCKDVILKETAQTLSDERVTSPDDAEAKYSRTVGMALLTIGFTITLLTEGDMEKELNKHSDILAAKELWRLASYQDSFVRRSLYRLLGACLSRLPSMLDYGLISTHVVQDASHVGQAGSSMEYIKILLQLTRSHPSVWIEDYSGSGKKSAQKRLSSYLRKGSQGAPAEYWQSLSAFLHDIPMQVLIENGNCINSLVSLREGVTRKDELRPSQNEAWKAYLQLSARQLSSDQVDDELVRSICLDHVLPLVSHYIRPSPESSSWTMVSHPQEICTLAIMVCLKASPETVISSIKEVSAAFLQDMQLSLPEQSQDFNKSQDAIISQAQRWYSLLAALQEKFEVIETARKEIEGAISVLRNRNGKPYSAAAAIDIATHLLPEVLADKTVKEKLLGFARQEVPKLVASPSSPYLFRILDALEGSDGIDGVHQQCLQTLADAPPSSERSRILETLLSSDWPKDRNASESLSTISKKAVKQYMDGKETWPLCILRNQAVPQQLLENLLALLTESLSANDQTSRALNALETISEHNGKALRGFVASESGTQLLSKLLFLSQLDNDDYDDGELKVRATRLKSTVNQATFTPDGANLVSESMIEILKCAAFDTSMTSLSMQSLSYQVKRLIEDDPKVAPRLLPESDRCFKCLEPYLYQLKSSLAITNPLGGSVNFVIIDHTTSPKPIEFDREGLSVPFRLAAYLISLEDGLKQSHGLYDYLAIYREILKDHLKVTYSSSLWSNNTNAVDLAHEQRNELQKVLMASSCDIFEILEASEGLSPLAYYRARAYSALASEATAVEDTQLAEIRRSENILRDTAFLSRIETSRASLKLCNELFSDLAGKPLGQSENAQRKLILLNRLIETYAGNLEDIPQQRLVFFVKHVTSSLESANKFVKAEALKVFGFVLPAIRELYGEFWEDILTLAIEALSSDDVPTLYYALSICALLRSMAAESANDDVEEAWSSKQESFVNATIELLDKSCDAPDMFDEPRKMVNDLLGNEMLDTTTKVSGLYKPLQTPSPSLQQTAFNILHQRIPASQEQISLDVALSDLRAGIPVELLSLVSSPPEIDYSALRRMSQTPAALSRYLLVWKLIFDHWTNASYKVQSQYADQIKAAPEHLQYLLAFVTELLVHRGGSKSFSKPTDVASFSQRPEALIAHLYYLSLLHLPYLVKDWWRSCPRSLEKPVEEWTEKYISPAVIAAELSTVLEWDPNPEDTEMEVKAGRSEVTAAYPIDEQTMSIRISVPPAYPLHPISVTTGQRVGIDEKVWSAWLNTSNIAINFNSSSQGLGCIIDGLVAWRKNVVGKLKGQSECAICYSVVSGDRQLPTKRCATCKHMFHGSCLFRWFKSSSSSSCPLCRNAFNY